MASIATGIAYHTLGKDSSSGAKMRAYQDDQSGGTDSGDARQAWARGYDEALVIRDGRTWPDVLDDLRAGRLVHLDVWHATASVCLSGSGQYGHTMAVAPDCKGGSWLVADPWCKPAKWARLPEATLKAGAEDWGRRVRDQTGGNTDPVALAIAAKVLMRRSFPEHEDHIPIPRADTGGPVPVMYTVTRPQPLTGGSTDMGILWNPTQWADPGIDLYLDSACTKKVTTTTAGGAPLTSLGPAAAQDPNGMDASSYSILVSTSKLATDPSVGNQRAILWAKRDDLPADTLKPPDAWDDSLWALSQDSTGRWPCPPAPDCPDEEEIITARDEEWVSWFLEGAPGQEPV